MKLGVLTSSTSWYWNDLRRAAISSDHLVPLSFSTLRSTLDPEPQFADNETEQIQAMDAILVRTMPPGSLEQVVFRMNILHRLQASGVTILNPPRCLEVAVDKYLASAELQAAGLPTPRTHVSQTWEDAMVGFESLGSDVVVKPLFGSEGRGILRVNDEAIAWRVFKTYDQLGHVIYQQEFIPHSGTDLRVLVLGHQCFAMRRSNPLDWRTNVSRGASTEPLELDDELTDLGRRAAAAVGAPFAGVDILPSQDGRRFVLEVNAVPGWRAIGRTLQIDIASQVLACLRQMIQETHGRPR